MAGDAAVQKFTFQYLAGKTFPSLELKDFQERLQKWGMENRIHAQAFCFDQEFKPYLNERFALDFCQSDEVVRSIKLTSQSGAICYGLGTKASSVQVETIPCTTISMATFDKLQESEIIQEGGYIRKCFEEYVDNVCLADQLRNGSQINVTVADTDQTCMVELQDGESITRARCILSVCKAAWLTIMVLLNEDYEKYDIYSDDERSEFIFRLFTHLCIGGGICQYEDTITPYLTHTKHLYKDLVSVQKEPGSSDLHVISYIYKLRALDSEEEIFFPDDKDHLNSFAYLIVDPVRRHVTLLHHKYAGGLW